jgi:hypothetical protein
MDHLFQQMDYAPLTDSAVKSRFCRRGFFFYFPSGVREDHGVLKSHVSLLAWNLASSLLNRSVCDSATTLWTLLSTTGGNTCFWSETRNSGLLREEALLDNQVPVEVAIAWITA